jgi:hypothetical protein
MKPIIIRQIGLANVKWTSPLQKNEKIIYIEMTAFNYIIPIKILLTPYSHNVIISKDLNYLSDLEMVVDINKPPLS